MIDIVNEGVNLIKRFRDLDESFVGEVIERFIEEIDESWNDIEEASDFENQKLSSKDVVIDILKSNINSSYGLIEGAVKNEFGVITKSFVSCGTVYVDLGTIDVVMLAKLVILALSTRNIILIRVNKNVVVNEIILNILNNLLKQENCEKLVQVVYEDVELEELNKFGLIVVNEDTKDKYEGLKVKVIGYPNVKLYVDDDIDVDLVLKISKMSNVKIYSKIELKDVIFEKVGSLEEALDKIGKNNYSCGVFTKSKEVARKFVERVCAKNVFVNVSPTNVIELDLYYEDLICRKNVCIFA